MNLKSIRWKLPLTYAGIALITALVLGGTLLVIVRRYYQDQELNYLRKNAVAISDAVGPFLTKDQTDSYPADLKDHLALMAFLSQTRVRLLDPNGNEMGTFAFIGENNPKAFLSAITLPNLSENPSEGNTTVYPNNLTSAAGNTTVYPNTLNPSAGATSVVPNNLNPSETKAGAIAEFTQDGDAGYLAIQFFQQPSSVVSNASGNPVTMKIISIPGGNSANLSTSKALISQIPAVGTMYGFDLKGDPAPNAARSDQVFRQAILAADGAVLGSVELSDGPAYGMDIVAKVASGWIIASLVGIFIAVLAGWWISRRINAPILVLTHSTRRMAAGDLSTRASLQSRDEFGALANSFNTMAERVEETVAALRRFVADAAHQLQTPLTALRTNLELASDQNRPEDQIAYLESAQKQVDRLNHLVRDLLDLSRLESGVGASQSVPLDLAAFARTVSEPFAAQAEQSGIDFEVQFPSGPVTINADEAQLQQALGNLLDNAVKFTPPAGVVTLSLFREGEWACLGVADTGIGIPPDDLPGLFERFHRGRNAAGYPGSGLGLAIVKAIAQSNQGKVSVESTPGGTCFRLCLPVLKEAERAIRSPG